jgi:ubiquinone/menaquinone biosynthesis C-methylase UbiE
MDKRLQILNQIYSGGKEENRLSRSRHGQLEYITTMHYIHRMCESNSKVLEVGAGTGRYSIELAKEGYDVTAVELIKDNLDVLKRNSENIKNIVSFQADALDLSRFNDEVFDLTMLLGPMYHLYDENDQQKAIDEAIRVTKNDGIIMVAFIPIYSCMYTNYLFGNFKEGLEENYTIDYKVKHFAEQGFTACDVCEFENLFKTKNVKYITTVSTDGILEFAEENIEFSLSNDDFELFYKYHLKHCEKRELLGTSNHLLYICKKTR